MSEVTNWFEYGVAGALCVQAFLFLYYFGKTINKVDEKHLQQHKESIRQYAALSDKYETAVKENNIILTKVDGSLINVKEAILRG